VQVYPHRNARSCRWTCVRFRIIFNSF